MGKTFDSIRRDCEKETARLQELQQKRMKQEALVKQFKNNNEEYAKIKKTVEEKVHSILSDRRMVLKLALLSLTDSMKNDPDKYSRLIYHNTPPTAASTWYNSNQYYEAVSSGQQQYPSQAYTDMLLDEAEKLYHNVAKDLVDETITDYASSTASSSLLPLLPPPEERQSHPATAAN
jgi:hypothetical protein